MATAHYLYWTLNTVAKLRNQFSVLPTTQVSLEPRLYPWLELSAFIVGLLNCYWIKLLELRLNEDVFPFTSQVCSAWTTHSAASRCCPWELFPGSHLLFGFGCWGLNSKTLPQATPLLWWKIRFLNSYLHKVQNYNIIYQPFCLQVLFIDKLF